MLCAESCSHPTKPTPPLPPHVTISNIRDPMAFRPTNMAHCMPPHARFMLLPYPHDKEVRLTFNSTQTLWVRKYIPPDGLYFCHETHTLWIATRGFPFFSFFVVPILVISFPLKVVHKWLFRCIKICTILPLNSFPSLLYTTLQVVFIVMNC